MAFPNNDIVMDFNPEYQETIPFEPWELEYQEIPLEYLNEEYREEYQEEILPENQTNISDTEAINVNTKKQRSWVWEHFTLDNNSSKPKCNYCAARVPSSKGNTSNMASHLRNKHSAKIKSSSGKQLTLQQTFQNPAIEVS
jgi:BED zinc finger